MRTRTGEEPAASRGATSWNDGVHPIDGAGLTDGSITEAQGVSAGPGGAQRGDAGTVSQTSWVKSVEPVPLPFFKPVEDDAGCKDGVCPVPWLTKEEAPVLQEDVVNHPSHYADSGSIECIEAIEAQLTTEEYQGYLRGNCVKYLWRWRNKGGKTDIDKCQWYLKRLQQTLEA